MKRLLVGVLLFGLVFLVGGAAGFALLRFWQGNTAAVPTAYAAVPVPDFANPYINGGDLPSAPAGLAAERIQELDPETLSDPMQMPQQFAAAAPSDVAGHAVVRFGTPRPQERFDDPGLGRTREIPPTPVAQARFVANEPLLSQAPPFNTRQADNNRFANTSPPSGVRPVPDNSQWTTHDQRSANPVRQPQPFSAARSFSSPANFEPPIMQSQPDPIESLNPMEGMRYAILVSKRDDSRPNFGLNMQVRRQMLGGKAVAVVEAMSASPMSDVSIFAKNITLGDSDSGFDLRCEGDVVVMTTHGLIRGKGLVYEGDEFKIESAKIMNPDTEITAGEITFPFNMGGVKVHVLAGKQQAADQQVRNEPVRDASAAVRDAGQPPVAAEQGFDQALPVSDEPSPTDFNAEPTFGAPDSQDNNSPASSTPETNTHRDDSPPLFD